MLNNAWMVFYGPQNSCAAFCASGGKGGKTLFVLAQHTKLLERRSQGEARLFRSWGVSKAFMTFSAMTKGKVPDIAVLCKVRSVHLFDNVLGQGISPRSHSSPHCAFGPSRWRTEREPPRIFLPGDCLATRKEN